MFSVPLGSTIGGHRCIFKRRLTFNDRARVGFKGREVEREFVDDVTFVNAGIFQAYVLQEQSTAKPRHVRALEKMNYERIRSVDELVLTGRQKQGYDWCIVPRTSTEKSRTYRFEETIFEDQIS